METDTLHLIDFGAAREYSQTFTDGYVDLVWASANSDLGTIERLSTKLGFLTGHESDEMKAAHEQAGLLVGEPFRTASGAPFDFHGSEMTKRLSAHSDTFMRERLTPPPREAYSLHRKLAGAYLMCIKLKAVIDCRDILDAMRAQFEADRAARPAVVEVATEVAEEEVRRSDSAAVLTP